MSSKVDLFLDKVLGKDFNESLAKVELWKPGTRTTIDHEEIRTALQIVPRTVISLLIRELVPMAIGETKDIEIFFGTPAKINVTKHERDVYSGKVIEDNKTLVDFKMRSLPGLGLIIMSAFELYDTDTLSQNSQPTVEPESAMKVQDLIDEKIALHDLIHKVVDQKLMHKDAIQQLLLMKLTAELEEAKKRAALAQAMVMAPVINTATIAPVEIEKSTIVKKGSPLSDFLSNRKQKIKKSEFVIELAKNETVDCPDCGKNIYNGQIFSGCICLGDDRERKLFIKKSENGIKIRFDKGWDPENIEMLLDILRRNNA